MTSEASSLEFFQFRSMPALAASLSPLVGREQEVELATSMLLRKDVRLLTLTGPGGIGKTRLSHEIASRIAPSFAEGVHFVQLAKVASAGLVAAAVAQSLGVRESGSADLRDLLVVALRNTNLLLVIDNFEHVEDAAPLVTDLLSHCSGLKVLATSRSLLRLTGEHALPVPPLRVPDAGRVHSLDQVASFAAVRLFLDRARAVAPTFALTDANAEQIVAICQRMDGLPLAIELAATQSRVLPPPALLSRIESHLPLPLAGPKDAPARHRTMHHAISWSYDLLDTDEQRAFRYASIFVDGFGVEAAEYADRAVRRDADDSTGQGAGVLKALASLVDKSLLNQEEWQGEARFSMLETIRRFALEQLEAHGEREAVCDAHADWCLELAGRTQHAAITPGGERQLSLIESEHANIRAALEWMYERDDPDRFVRLVLALAGFWYEHNHYLEARTWVERALPVSHEVSGDGRARLLVQSGIFLSMLDDTARAAQLLDEGLSILRETGDMLAVALVLVWQGAVANFLGDHDRAEHLLEEALGLATTLDDPPIAASMTARALANLGSAAHGRGDLDLAIVRYERALQICREHGYLLGAVRTLCDLGDLGRDQGDYIRAMDCYRECFSLLGNEIDQRVVVRVLEGAALAAVAWDAPERAAQLLGAADALAFRLGMPIPSEVGLALHQRTVAAINVALKGQGFNEAWSRGRRMTLAQAIAEVLAMAPPDPSERRDGPAAMRLSRRENEVLQLLAAGCSDREIADTLSLSVRTVEGHVTHIRAKLGVQTRTAAVAYAITSGLVDPASLKRD